MIIFHLMIIKIEAFCTTQLNIKTFFFFSNFQTLRENERNENTVSARFTHFKPNFNHKLIKNL